MRKRHVSSFLLLLLLLCAIVCNTVYAGWWQDPNNGRYWYEDVDGTAPEAGLYRVEDSYYIFDFDGYLVTDDWSRMDDGSWYYSQSDGSIAVNTWIGNYYVGADGKMLTNAWTPDGYYVGADGAWVSDAGNLNYSGQQAAASSGFEAGWIYGTYRHDFGDGKIVEIRIGWESDTGIDIIYRSGYHISDDGYKYIYSSDGTTYTDPSDGTVYVYNGVDTITEFYGTDSVDYHKVEDLSHFVS